MYRIAGRRILSPAIKLMDIEAPEVAAAAQPGQFVILRLHARGERVPLTIADCNRKQGTVTIIFQEVGKSTSELGRLEAGQSVRDFCGPLGRPFEPSRVGTAVCVGGGVGIAPLYPIAKSLQEAGNQVVSIIGARSKDLLILEEEMRAISGEATVTTDDGSYGRQGFVSQPLAELLAAGGVPIGLVVAIGPIPMMRSVVEVAREHPVPVLVSLDPIMIDGTGMCGGCRVSVGGESRFACVDGPLFDGKAVDFAELASRRLRYQPQEKQASEIFQQCCQGEGRCQQ